jgi:hypothetical protein
MNEDFSNLVQARLADDIMRKSKGMNTLLFLRTMVFCWLWFSVAIIITGSDKVSLIELVQLILAPGLINAFVLASMIKRFFYMF